MRLQDQIIQATNEPSRYFGTDTGGPTWLGIPHAHQWLFSLCHVIHTTSSARGQASVFAHFTPTLGPPRYRHRHGSSSLQQFHHYPSGSGPILERHEGYKLPWKPWRPSFITSSVISESQRIWSLIEAHNLCLGSGVDSSGCWESQSTYVQDIVFRQMARPNARSKR